MIDERVEFAIAAKAIGLNLGSGKCAPYEDPDTERAWQIWTMRSRLDCKIKCSQVVWKAGYKTQPWLTTPK